jgi:RND family efflux transporter MFP subunit
MDHRSESSVSSSSHSSASPDGKPHAPAHEASADVDLRRPEHPQPPSSRRLVWLRLLALIILALAVATAAWWMNHRPSAPKRATVDAPAPSVEGVTGSHAASAPTLEGFGRIIADRETTISTRVSGLLAAFPEGIEAGREVKKDQLLASVDKVDYQLALRQAEADLATAQASLATEKGEQIRAASEYKTFGRNLPAAQKALVLREPQLKSAQATVESAAASRDQARANLARTDIRAPFDGLVSERLVGEGSDINAFTDLLTMVASDRFWVRLNLPQADMEWLSTHARDGQGTPVLISSKAWPEGQHRLGEVWSVLPSLEENGLLTQVMVAVDDPLALKVSDEARTSTPALRIGDIVEASLSPTRTASLIELPISALRSNQEVWVLTPDNYLEKRSIRLRHLGNDSLLVADGLVDGERVITSALSSVEAGMALRAQGDDTPATQPATQPAPSDEAGTKSKTQAMSTSASTTGSDS